LPSESLGIRVQGTIARQAVSGYLSTQSAQVIVCELTTYPGIKKTRMRVMVMVMMVTVMVVWFVGVVN